MSTTTKVPLGELPGMDDIKIGPGGETFGQLKDAVIDARQAFKGALLRGQASPERMEAYERAVDLLKAAYTRVGLPYKAP